MAEMRKEWYVVNTYAGHENKVKDNLQRRVETMGLQDALFQIVVAEETEIEYKNGKEVFLNGYRKPFYFPSFNFCSISLINPSAKNLANLLCLPNSWAASCNFCQYISSSSGTQKL